jgi:hypothetical protein
MKKKRPTPAQPAPLVVGVAWYRADQWQRLRSLAADAHVLHDTYTEWEASALERLADFHAGGVPIQPVLIDIDELAQWCREHNRPLDTQARSAFAAEKVQELSAMAQKRRT